MKKNTVLSIALSLFLSVSASAEMNQETSYSSGAPTASGVKPVGTQKEDSKIDIYRGQSRAYEDANQEYAKIALYEYDKLVLVQQKYNAWADATDPDEKAGLGEALLADIKDACPANYRTSVTDCFSSYKNSVTARLRMVRKYNGTNADMVAKLRMPLYKPNGDTTAPLQTPGIYVQQEAKAKEAVVPQLKTLKDMKKDTEKLKLNTTEMYREYAKGMVREPSRDDFVKYKSIPRNPNAPEEGGKLLVLDTSCGKPTCIDEKAYQAALEKFQKDQTIQDRLKNYQRDIAVYGQVPNKPEVPVSLKPNQLQEDAYQSSRELMVGETNKLITKGTSTKVPELKPGEESAVIKLPSSTDDREYRLHISPDLLSEKTLEKIEQSDTPQEWFQKSNDKFQKNK